MQTRAFYVVDSDEENPELFETLEQAQEYIATSELKNLEIAICQVRHAYQEDNGEWSYEDLSDTFQIVKYLTTA